MRIIPEKNGKQVSAGKINFKTNWIVPAKLNCVYSTFSGCCSFLFPDFSGIVLLFTHVYSGSTVRLSFPSVCSSIFWNDYYLLLYPEFKSLRYFQPYWGIVQISNSRPIL